MSDMYRKQKVSLQKVQEKGVPNTLHKLFYHIIAVLDCLSKYIGGSLNLVVWVNGLSSCFGIFSVYCSFHVVYGPFSMQALITVTYL